MAIADYQVIVVGGAIGGASALLTGTPHRIRYALYGWGTGHYEWIQDLEGGKSASRYIGEKILGILGLGSGGHRGVERH